VLCGWNHRFIFLQVLLLMLRIYGLRAMLHADGDPSGLVPGVIDGCCVSRLWQSDIGVEGPDHVFSVASKVFLARVEDICVIFVFLMVLFVKLPTT
jgi:hypothetical protein